MWRCCKPIFISYYQRDLNVCAMCFSFHPFIYRWFISLFGRAFFFVFCFFVDIFSAWLLNLHYGGVFFFHWLQIDAIKLAASRFITSYFDIYDWQNKEQQKNNIIDLVNLSRFKNPLKNWFIINGNNSNFNDFNRNWRSIRR